jgi:zinc finger-like protein
VGSGGAATASEVPDWARFHSTFQAALTQEMEALVRDLQAAAGAVATPARRPAALAAAAAGAGAGGGEAVVKDAAWPADAAEMAGTRALVGELVARWSMMLAIYRAHVAAEDAVVLPALAARVSNVAHAYELEHEAEDSLLDGVTAALDEAVDAAAAAAAAAEVEAAAGAVVAAGGAAGRVDTQGAEQGPGPGQGQGSGPDHRRWLRAAIQGAARTAHATKTALAMHLAKAGPPLSPTLSIPASV